MTWITISSFKWATVALVWAMSSLTILLGSSANAAEEAGPATETPVQAFPVAPGGGKAEAMMRLADMYLNGRTVPRDAGRAFALYNRAALSGSHTAALQVGDMLARGQGVPKDLERGLKVIQEIAETGDARALLALGDLYSEGSASPMRPDAAISSYLAAAKLGNTVAMIRLGDIYRAGRFSRPQRKQAAVYYRMASDAGNPFGMFALGRLLVEGRVGKAGTPAEGMDLLAKAEKAGIDSAAGAIAESYFYGHGVRQNTAHAVDVLDQAMARGNIDAALRMVAAYRDGKANGRSRLVKRNSAKARKLLDSLSVRLSGAEMAYQQFLMEASIARTQKLDDLYARLRAFSEPDRQRLVRDLRRTNPNLLVYAAQVRLKELDIYHGKPTGMLNARTSRALSRHCRKTAVAYFCSRGPMSGNNTEILSYAF